MSSKTKSNKGNQTKVQNSKLKCKRCDFEGINSQLFVGVIDDANLLCLVCWNEVNEADPLV